MVVILALLCIFFLFTTFAPLTHRPEWWIRVWDFPRLQLLILSLLLAIVNFTMLFHTESSWQMTIFSIALIAHIICIAYQSYWIFPYTKYSKKQVIAATGYDTTHPRLRLMVTNVLTPNRHAEKLLALIATERPDIVVAVETDQWWQTQLDVIETDYPYTIKCPLDNLYGMHIYSRLPISEEEIQFLVDEEIPSMHMKVHLNDHDEIILHCLHPMPPSPTENDESSDRDAELVMVGKTAAKATLPVIVTGDLNDVAWSQTTRLFLKMSQLLDPRRGRGMYSTFHAHHAFLRWPLDHVFHSDDFILGSIRRLDSIGSDHFPILVELVLKPREGQQQEGLEKTSSDEELAQEKLAETHSSPNEVHQPT